MNLAVESDLIASNFIECMSDCFIYQNVLMPTFQVSFGCEKRKFYLKMEGTRNFLLIFKVLIG
jgi:hypothetical protein